MKNKLINLLLILVIPGLGYSQTNLRITGFVDGSLSVPAEINLEKILTENISLRAQIDNVVYDAPVGQACIRQRGCICDCFNSPTRYKNLDALVKYQCPHSLLQDEASLIFLAGHPILNNISRSSQFATQENINK